MAAVASFHLTSVSAPAAPLALARLGLDRVRLRTVPGVRFWRLLGTGRGSDTGPGADLRRTALFAIWDDAAALDAFEASPTARHRGVVEACSIRLTTASGHGRWRGFDVVGALPPRVAGDDGPVAVVTRADVRLPAWRTFAAASRTVSRDLAMVDGLLAVCGIGEAPVGRLGTFSVWASAAAARRYSQAVASHAHVVERTRAERWYGEELFATFAIDRVRGTWDGRDPTAPLSSPGGGRPPGHRR